MRLGSTVLLSNQACVQSYHWAHFRPLGKLQTVIDELDNYECDEIAIIRPVRQEDTLQAFEKDIAIIRTLKSMTPISFGGGIRTQRHLELIVDLPVERLIFSSAFLLKDKSLLENAIKHFGRQSIQCLLPVMMEEGNSFIYNCSTGEQQLVSSLDFDFIDHYANEVIIYDCNREGERDCFDFRILEQIRIDSSRLVICGGVGHDTNQRGNQFNVASVLIDNKTLHREYSVAGYKHAANM